MAKYNLASYSWCNVDALLISQLAADGTDIYWPACIWRSDAPGEALQSLVDELGVRTCCIWEKKLIGSKYEESVLRVSFEFFNFLDDIWRNSQSRWAIHACQCWANWWGEAVNSNKRKTFCQLLTGSLRSLPKNGQKLERKAGKSPLVMRAGISDGCDCNTVILLHVFTLVLDLLPHALTHTGGSMTPNVC